MLFLFVLAYIVGVSFFVTYKKGEAESNFFRVQGTTVRYITSLAEEREESAFTNYVQFQLAMLSDCTGFFAILQEEESGEIVSDCGKRLFLIRSCADVTDSMAYVCDPTEIPGWRKYRQELQKHNKALVHLYETVEFSNIYTDGRHFVPNGMWIKATCIKAIEYYLAREDYQTYEIIDTYIEQPVKESIPDGYVKVEPKETEGTWLGPIVVGYSESSPSKNYYCSSDASYALLLQLKRDRENERYDESGYNKVQESFFRTELTSLMEITLKEGRKVELLAACVYDVWEMYGGWLTVIAVVMLLFATLMSYLFAKVSYARLKASYDVEDYRRNLMNTMAHDLKSPLMAISGYAENLQDNLHSEKQDYYSEAILDNVQYMKGIIESVLSLSKAENGNVMLKWEKLNVFEMLQELIRAQETHLQKNRVTIDVEGELELEADKVLFEQVLCNLLDNAVKYASNNTTICVMMKEKEINFRNRCDMDLREVADSLCDPFVVGDSSRGNRKGSGLGLAIAKNICQLHGYDLELVCEEESFEVKILI